MYSKERSRAVNKFTRYKRKTVMVTGASRGIGKSIALKFAKEGYNVVINCHNSEDDLYKVEKEILSLGADCLPLVFDVSDFYVCKQNFEKIQNRFHSLDVLVNNAGISYIGLIQDMDISDWNNIINTNLTSVFNCSKFAIPNMLKAGSGHIINISSIWGVVGASCESAYSASKGGINSFTKALAKELAPSKIQVNAVALGIIDTDMNEFLSREELESIIDEIPLGRVGKCDEVAEFIYCLTESYYLTGQVIRFDGGWG